jgi:hypothetical protein
MDRGYLDFDRLYRLHQNHAFFVTRRKINTRFRRIYSAEIDKTTGLKCDQAIILSVSIFEKMPIYQALTNTFYEKEITTIISS